MTHKYKKPLTIFIATGVLALGTFAFFQGNSGKMSPELAIRVGENTPTVQARTIGDGSLLTADNPEQALARAKNGAAVRSPAFDADATVDIDFATLSKEFLAREDFAAREEKLKEFFPDGKGVNRSIRLTLLLAFRGMDTEDAYSEIQLGNRVRSEVMAHGEAAVISLDEGLAKLPKEMVHERQAIIQLMSSMAKEQPSFRGEVKTSLIGEATRSGGRPEAALALTQLLKVNGSKEWYQEVSESYERLNPGSELSEVVATNLVAM